MIKDFKLDNVDRIYDWSGEEVESEKINLLKVGDCVRVSVRRNMNKPTKLKFLFRSKDMYFQITRIDRYKYGGIHKPRKFYGVAMDIYNQFDGVDYISEGQEINFRAENICELPGFNWDELMKIGKILKQKNKKNLDRFDYKWDADNYEDYCYYKEYPEEREERHHKLFKLLKHL